MARVSFMNVDMSSIEFYNTARRKLVFPSSADSQSQQKPLESIC